MAKLVLLVLLVLIVATGTSAADDQPGAEQMFASVGALERAGNGDAVVARLREYIAKFGPRGGRDRLVIAYAKIGLTLWHRSCPVPELDGTCASSSAQPRLAVGSLPVRCGPQSRPLVTIVRRDPRKVKDAMNALDNAIIELGRLPGSLGGDETTVRALHGQAKLVAADLDFEAYLAQGLPQGLDFEPSSHQTALDSVKRFDDWVSQKSGLGRRLVAKYEAVLAVNDAASSIGAAARIGQVAQGLFDALGGAPIPASVRSGPEAGVKVAAFCDKLAAVAELAEVHSIRAFERCLAKSTELSWFDDSSKLCERALERMRPDLYPPASELRAAPNATAPITAVEANPSSP